VCERERERERATDYCVPDIKRVEERAGEEENEREIEREREREIFESLNRM
jgi:hypothetical protein